ncbi:putative LRR receptor-like serine/threonine-protein kinase [Dichanthelium oligosanthes]|uniref:Putative LRR receptor-like serine/threonine-protein kinase n=1 Tax=Dichanthelium oligosanthes TaxID=888268 RepID=A0A1E5V5F8_9POAL|nr:putative LRR receptor-like serine/threonine-protein kinase [Dichanthelium oligosanthes]
MPLHVHHLLLLLLVLLATSLPASATSSNASSSCAGRHDAAAIAAAFRYVRNFRPPSVRPCQPVRELRLPSRNLTGAVSWAALANLSALAALDLSGNALQGAIPGGFWRAAPSLRTVDVSRNQLGGALRVEESPRLLSLNVSGNRFTGVEGVDGLSGLVALDVSANRIRAVPRGLRRLARVTQLDLSRNAMQGRFPGDLPPLGGVRSLNVSYNRFSGVVDSGTVKKFGHSAFAHAGNASLVFSEHSTITPPRRPSPSPPHGKSKKDGSGRTTEKKTTRRSKKRRHLSVVAVAVICGVSSLAMLLCLVGCVACGVLRCRKKGGKDDEEEKKPQWGEKGEDEEDVVVTATKGASGAPVVLFERPLMQLTLADLAAATSGFGRESQLAERGGRSGAAYRAVLPGDLHVVVRVVEGAMAGLGEDDNPAAAATAFRELARLRHPNILPLLGYCIAGKEKLLLYEYMEKGDLHRWLHELPAGQPDMDDTGSGDIWEAAEDKRSISDWPTRHRIALGVARGLAFLHQGWAGGGSAVVHGHLVPTNVLLGDDLEPRISDFGHPPPSGGEDAAAAATPEGDVYAFGVLVLELVTGQAGWDEASVSWARGIVRDGKGIDIVDPRVRDEAAAEAERELVECLRVGYLCTAHSDKRPTMQQVVGVLKDIRAAPATPPGAQSQPA